MDEVEVAGLRIAYHRVGHGPPLVLVHGFVGDGRSTWGHQLEALSDDFTVVAWDGPGTGGSAGSTGLVPSASVRGLPRGVRRPS